MEGVDVGGVWETDVVTLTVLIGVSVIAAHHQIGAGEVCCLD